ncbi:inositol-hexakisphosphate 5-kinase [Entomortierella parvispora]|uniref:Kinase n=1 Tax=Entomortierella parvispora TaxID=205924 RepID=A0A9P3H5L0_9FUNG|nr:inositol-hexakisphosphate 5-kinase [Entomortierella parvispora]
MILNPLQNQVGGHDGVLSMGEENEIIVKPSLPQEHQFYEETAALHPELAAWMPVYYGSLTLARPTAVDPTSTAEAGGPTIKALNGYALTDLLSFEQSTSDLIQKVQAQSLTEEGNEGDRKAEEGEDAGEKTKAEGEDECLCLENLSHGFKKPCVLDLKLGTQLFDDDATEEKKARLGAVSANTTSGSLGIRLTGFQIYDSEKQDYVKFSKQYGKSLTTETILDGFRSYFSAQLGPKRMRLVLERFVSDLTDFLSTIEDLELRMRSSSLLMLYEGDAEAFDEGLQMEEEKIAAVVERVKAHQLAEQEAEDAEGEENQDQDAEAAEESEEDEDEEEDYDDEDDEDVSQKVTDLRLIDFAHSAWTPGMGPDEGVILGVKSTLALFERLLEEDYPASA